MKLGTENKKLTIIAGVLVVIALILVARMILSSSGTPSSETPPKPAARVPAGGSTSATSGGAENTSRVRRAEKIITMTLKPTLDPRLRLDLLRSSEETKYEGTGRNIFMEEAVAAIPQPIKNPRMDLKHQVQAVPQGPPPPPPINLKFFGYASRTGEQKRIFLSQGSTVFTAHEGDIVAGRYRVVHINSTSVEIQDVLSNNTQTIPMTRG